MDLIKKFIIASFTGMLLFSNAFATNPYAEVLASKIRRIAQASNSEVGVSAIYIEKNQKFSYNGTRPVFMASTMKVPIALTLLHRVDVNQDYLERQIQLSTKNSVPGSGGLHHLLDRRRVNISLRQLLALMLVNSDNSATDAILKEINGPQTVTERLRTLGFNNTKVSRPILGIFLDAHGVNKKLTNRGYTTAGWQKVFKSVAPKQKIQAWHRFENDRRDSTTPNEMALVLTNLYKGRLVSPESTNLLLSLMRQCHTGRNRIKGLLPPGTPVAHKTGTWTRDNSAKFSKNFYSFMSDVGIITLPNNRGHIAVAIYVRSKSPNSHSRSQTIARLSRAVYDYYQQGN